LATSCPLAIARAIITNLSAGSVLDGNVGIDYSVIERVDKAGAVIGWNNIVSTMLTQSDEQRNNTYTVELFIKDTGSASATMDNLFVFPQRVLISLRKDDTLQGTVEQVNQIRMSRTPGEIFVTGGAVALFPIDIEIDVLEWPA